MIAPEELERAGDEVVAEASRVVAEAAAAGEVGSPGATVVARRDPPAHLVAGAALLSSLAAAWVAGNLLRGALLARGMAAVGALIGAGLLYLGKRSSRPALAQYAVLPVAALVGAAFVAPSAKGGTANLAGLIGEALGGGGLSAAPIDFAPGWRFLLVVLFAVVAAAASAIAFLQRSAKLAVVVPLPVTMGAAMLQPAGSEIASGTVAVFLVTGALALAYGADLAAQGSSLGGGFELRRLLRGAGMAVVLMLAMVVLAQTDVLFPEARKDRIIPPQKPPTGTLEKDRELFVVKGDAVGPWRMGVLDGYDGTSWLLPPFDRSRNVDIASGERFPDAPAVANTEDVEIKVTDLRGRSLPLPGGTVSVQGAGSLEVDPRSMVASVEGRVPQGLSYTVTAAPAPSAAELNATGEPRADLSEFTKMPVAPPEVAALIAEAPAERFDRLQFLRDRLYRSVVAAGEGKPVDIPPARVAELLQQGTEATPYEITAAEAMLVRWAGQPARMGFGYYRGDKLEDGFSIHPKHGSVWLEVWFEGYGWLPLVGVPPQARSSLSAKQTNDDPRVQPSDELALTVYIPVQEDTFALLFEIIRYWLLVLSPFVVVLLGLWASYPWLCKVVRRMRRERWGRTHGPQARALAAYAEMRDRCYDLNLGDVRHTPLLFVGAFEYDAEHDELAWLVTRLLWGDLSRDPREDDARDAEAMCESVQRRILGAQGAANRLLGAISKASLRDPYDDLVPNVWPQPHVRSRLRVLRRPFRPVASVLRRAVRRPAAATAALVLVALLLASGCVQQGGFDGAEVPTAYPERIAPEPPDSILGLQYVREPTAELEYANYKGKPLVTEGRVFTIRDALETQGSLQVALFKKKLDGSSPEVQAKIERGIGGGFVTAPIGTIKLRRRELPEQILYLWFPPERNVMVLFTMRRKFAKADEAVVATIAYMRGLDAEPLLSGGPT